MLFYRWKGGGGNTLFCHLRALYITKFALDSLVAKGGAQNFFGGFRWVAKHIFCCSLGANFFSSHDVVFKSANHVINATSLTNSRHLVTAVKFI